MATLILALVMGIAFNSSDVNAQMGTGMMGSGGTAWVTGAFRSNGERIYFTATSRRGTEIMYTGGATSSGWMMMGGRLACVSCHGTDGRGGKRNMGMLPATIIYTFIGHEIPVMEKNFPILLTYTTVFIFILVVFSIVQGVRKKT